MSWAFVFPGQGAQAIGMGKDLADAYPAAKAVFEEVNEALGEDLSGLIWDGDIETLTMTANAQPALMATSIAALRAMEVEGVSVSDASYVAGHSLGEYSALAAVNSFSIGDAARLLRIRGNAMQAAAPAGLGAMAAILGLGFDAASQVAEDAAEGDVCQAANDNDPGQVVISGHRTAVERAIELAKAAGAKRAIMLPVSAPFHCALMQPAADRMAAALSDVTINAPVVPIVSNVKAEAVSAPDEIRDLLIRQITGSVRWRESVAWMAGQGVSGLVEVGAGKALSGMARRIDKSLSAIAVNGADDAGKAAEAIKG